VEFGSKLGLSIIAGFTTTDTISWEPNQGKTKKHIWIMDRPTPCQGIWKAG